MDILTITLIAIGLALDCFAVSLAMGSSNEVTKISDAFIVALLFGGFQIGMNLIGWGAGTRLVNFIGSFDHWIAFILLSIIGVKMMVEGLKKEDGRGSSNYLEYMTLTILSIATSIDSLGVGLSFALLKTNIILPALIIGMVSFTLSFAGVMLGDRLTQAFGEHIEILGGLILIGIGIRILIEHGVF